MAHDVFVSYSSKDKSTADAVCAVLESHGIRCWVAPRDILPGQDWGGSIIEAIKGARAMVLVFSANANTSEQIKREVERAVNKGVPVIPLRIEDVAPTETLEYFISTPHWLDAFTPPLERHLEYLAEVARKIVGGPEVSSAAVAEREARARLAEAERQVAQLAELELAEEKKAAEAKAARLADPKRKLKEAAKAAEAKRKAAEMAERARLAGEERARAAETAAQLTEKENRRTDAAAEAARFEEKKRRAKDVTRAKASVPPGSEEEQHRLAMEAMSRKDRPALLASEKSSESRHPLRGLGVLFLMAAAAIGAVLIAGGHSTPTYMDKLGLIVAIFLGFIGINLILAKKK